MDFRENFEGAFEDYLELVAISDFPLAVDPFSMGIDERTIDEITPDERQIVWQTVCNELGVSPVCVMMEKHFVRSYDTKTEQGEKIGVTVISTQREGIFLHILTYTDGEVRWMLGPNVNI